MLYLLQSPLHVSTPHAGDDEELTAAVTSVVEVLRAVADGRSFVTTSQAASTKKSAQSSKTVASQASCTHLDSPGIWPHAGVPDAGICWGDAAALLALYAVFRDEGKLVLLYEPISVSFHLTS